MVRPGFRRNVSEAGSASVTGDSDAPTHGLCLPVSTCTPRGGPQRVPLGTTQSKTSRAPSGGHRCRRSSRASRCTQLPG